MDKEDVVHIYNRILLSHKKNEMMPFAATWMDLEIIILSKVSQRTTNTIWYHLYVDLKYDTNELIYKTNRLTDKENRLVVAKGEGVEEG